MKSSNVDQIRVEMPDNVTNYCFIFKLAYAMAFGYLNRIFQVNLLLFLFVKQKQGLDKGFQTIAHP